MTFEVKGSSGINLPCGFAKQGIKVFIFRRICNIQEKLFNQQGRFFSDQNCQLFLFKNK